MNWLPYLKITAGADVKVYPLEHLDVAWEDVNDLMHGLAIRDYEFSITVEYVELGADEALEYDQPCVRT